MSDDGGTRIVKTPMPRPGTTVNEGTRAASVTQYQRLLVQGELREQMSRLVDTYQRPGLLTLVVGRDGLRGHFWTAITDEFRVQSIGRHTHCGVALEGPALSLRHLLLVTGRPGDLWRGRLLDLSTATGFIGVDQQVYRDVYIDGLAMVRVPGYWLVFIETGPRRLWEARDLDDLGAFMAKDRKAQDRELWLGAQRRTRDPNAGRVTQNRLVEQFDETPLGFLEIEAPEGSGRARLDRRTLATGVLIGRDDRCLDFGFELGHCVSRVHAVVLLLGDEVYIADAGSTNGVRLDGDEVSCARMEPARTYMLNDDTGLRWAPLH